MKTFRSLRILLLALAVSLIPASSFGGVFISVNFAPPVLPVYVQPPCPEPGLLWVPGYWAYDQNGYYWVPGQWIYPPYEGALWTPPYWGWSGGLYVFHPGYWGLHVGYYGGVNYGFGYMGVGYVGGRWHGHTFIYNTAITRVNTRYIHNVYVDRDVVRRNTIRNERRVSFNGGRDGIRHNPMPSERFAERDRHVQETRFQQSHVDAARSDRSNYARNNGGRPRNVVVDRPQSGGRNSVQDNRGAFQGRNNGNDNQRNQNQATPADRGRNDNARSNARSFDNRGSYNPQPSAGNQNRNNEQRVYQAPQNRNASPQRNNQAPQFRNNNNSHASQGNMRSNGGGAPQRQERGNQGGGGDRGGHGGRGHGR
jgi:hypothetical protein